MFTGQETIISPRMVVISNDHHTIDSVKIYPGKRSGRSITDAVISHDCQGVRRVLPLHVERIGGLQRLTCSCGFCDFEFALRG